MVIMVVICADETTAMHRMNVNVMMLAMMRHLFVLGIIRADKRCPTMMWQMVILLVVRADHTTAMIGMKVFVMMLAMGWHMMILVEIGLDIQGATVMPTAMIESEMMFLVMNFVMMMAMCWQMVIMFVIRSHVSGRTMMPTAMIGMCDMAAAVRKVAMMIMELTWLRVKIAVPAIQGECHAADQEITFLCTARERIGETPIDGTTPISKAGEVVAYSASTVWAGVDAVCHRSRWYSRYGSRSRCCNVSCSGWPNPCVMMMRQRCNFVMKTMHFLERLMDIGNGPSNMSRIG
jgi:hypothetical protein